MAGGARRIVTLMAAGLATFAAACRKEEAKGDPINAPLVQPPVKDNLPSGIADGAGLALDGSDAATMLTALRDFIYPTNGFVGPVQRLGMIDQRLAELDKQAEESQRQCLDETAGEFVPAAAMADGTRFALWLQCQMSVSTPSAETKAAQVGFGMTGEHFYLIERVETTAGSGIVVLVKEPMAGTSSEIWEMRYKSAEDPQSGGSEVVTWFHIKAAPGAVELETAASALSEGALSCGIQMRSDQSLIYVNGALAAGGQCGQTGESCVDASTLAAKEISACEAAGLTTFTMLGVEREDAEDSLAGARSVVTTAVSGFTDFGQTAD